LFLSCSFSLSISHSHTYVTGTGKETGGGKADVAEQGRAHHQHVIHPWSIWCTLPGISFSFARAHSLVLLPLSLLSLLSLAHALSLSLSRFSLLLSVQFPSLFWSPPCPSLFAHPRSSVFSLFISRTHAFTLTLLLSRPPREGPPRAPPAPALSMNLAGWPMGHSLALGVPSNACSSQRQTKI